jgi:HlyD family secretion protein
MKKCLHPLERAGLSDGLLAALLLSYGRMRWGCFFALLLIAGCAKWNDQPRRDAASGTIEVDETRVASRYGGRVEEILAWEGDTLKPGQALVRLDAAELKARRAQASAALDELKAGPRKEELESAKNDWQSVVAQLEFARADAKRAVELYADKTVPAAERDRAVSQEKTFEKNMAAARSRYDLLLAGTRPERIAQAEAQLHEIETQIREMDIVAPTNAVLEVLNVRVGDVLAQNQNVATLLLLNHLWVRVYVPEPWLGHIKLDEKVRVRVDSFPNKDFTGVVEQIARAAEFTPRNVQTVSDRVKQVFGIKVRLPTEGDQLRAGMAADVYFPNIPKELQ